MANLVLDVSPIARIQQVIHDPFFSPVRMALAAENAGIDGLALVYAFPNSVVSEQEVRELNHLKATFLNVFIPFHPDAIRQVLSIAPDMVTFVHISGDSSEVHPLPILEMQEEIHNVVADFKANSISTALFIPPEFETLKVVGKLDVDAVVLDCREFTDAPDSNARLLAEENLQTTAHGAFKLGLSVNLMGNIEREHLPDLKKIAFLDDIILGNAIFKRAFYNGLEAVIAQLRSLVNVPQSEY